MRITHITLFLGLSILLSSCVGWTRVYYFDFHNKSPKDIYIIVDTNTNDDLISLGGWCQRIPAESIGSVESDVPWDQTIRDSIYVYVIDASMVSLPTAPLSQVDYELLDSEMVLDRITVLHQDTVSGKFSLTFPSDD